MNISFIKSYAIIAIIVVTFFVIPGPSYSNPSYPNFTEVVEKNIPAVVIVHAKKKILGNNNINQSIPNLPEELKPFLDKFFDGENGNPSEPRKAPSFGSGFILTKDGYIMTNNHVIANSDEITITMSDQTELSAKLVGSDERSDLALLKVDADDLPTVNIGTSENLKLGEWVLAIGSPFGFDHTVTAGIVSGKKRNLPNESYVPYIQTDVAINPGNSGGPLFNLKGDVVGVNAQIYTRSGGFMGVSFAIPAETLSNVYKQLKKDGKVKRGWLGVYIQEVDKDLAISFGLDKPKGAVVAKILDKSPAQKSGLMQGDVILSFDNKDVNKSKDLPLLVGSTEVNRSVKVKILRNKSIIYKNITIEELPEDNQIASMREKPVDNKTISGLTVSDINENTKKSLNIYGGIKVDEISSEQLNQSKIQVNDIITHINNKPIFNVKDFSKKIQNIKDNSVANLLVYRNSTPVYLAIKISK
jgi:serine protease Do